MQLKTITGHRLPAFCVLFDKSDRRVITGGDDGIVKIWCVRSGILLFSLRAHSNCISDMGIDASNTVLACGSLDGYISFWDLRTGHPLFTINAFSPILTLEFRPMESASREIVLMASCSDGYAKFWAVNLQQRTFTATPVKFHCKSLARDEIRCASFSPAGLRLLTGATDGIVRLFKVPEVTDIRSTAQTPTLMPFVQYLEDHEGYVNSVHFGVDGTKFVTSSWDGCIRQWTYDSGPTAQKSGWRSTPFDTSTILGQSADSAVPGRPRKVTIVTYCNNDESFVAAVNQSFELILFVGGGGPPERPQRQVVLPFHQGEVYILTTHPIDDRIVLSAGCDGRAALWDMVEGRRFFDFYLENTRFLDGSFSQDGAMFSLVDDLGRVSLFGTGISPDAYADARPSQFFPTDWNDLIFDADHNALDAVTQRPPHLACRSQIVSIEKSPYTTGRAVSEAYATSIPIEGDEAIALRNAQMFLRQFESETALFQREVANTPPGSLPKHTRARRKRLLYGSDVEDAQGLLFPLLADGSVVREDDGVEGGGRMRPSVPILPADDSDDEPFAPMMGHANASETDADLSVDESTPYNLRRRHHPSQSPLPAHGPTRRSPRHGEAVLIAQRRGDRHRRIQRRLVLEDDEEGEDQVYVPIHTGGPSDHGRRSRSRHLSGDSTASPLRRQRHQRSGSPHDREQPLPVQGARRQEQQRGPSEWISVTGRQAIPYLPQVYDIVAYFPKGHQQFLERESDGRFHDTLPWNVVSGLGNVVIAQVISVSFFPGPPTWCIIDLIVVQPPSGGEAKGGSSEGGGTARPTAATIENSVQMQISYYDMENQADFIIPYCKYHWHVLQREPYKINDAVRVRFGPDEAYDGRIRTIKVPHHRIPDRPWQCYTVEWTTLDDAPEDFSPWELEDASSSSSSSHTGPSYHCTEALSADIISVVGDALARHLNGGAGQGSFDEGDDRFAPFLHPVNYSAFPNYLDDVPYPMDVATLYERITSNYYRRIEAFEWDIQLIYDNAFAYNQPGSAIVADARYVVDVLMRLARRTRRPIRGASHAASLLPTTAGSGSDRDGAPLSRRRLERIQDEAAGPTAALPSPGHGQGRQRVTTTTLMDHYGRRGGGGGGGDIGGRPTRGAMSGTAPLDVQRSDRPLQRGSISNALDRAGRARRRETLNFQATPSSDLSTGQASPRATVRAADGDERRQSASFRQGRRIAYGQMHVSSGDNSHHDGAPSSESSPIRSSARSAITRQRTRVSPRSASLIERQQGRAATRGRYDDGSDDGADSESDERGDDRYALKRRHRQGASRAAFEEQGPRRPRRRSPR